MMKSLSSTTNHNVRPRGMLRKPSRTRPGKLFAISRKAAIGKPYRRMPPGHTDCTTMVTPVKDNEKIVKNIPQGKIPIKNSDCLLKTAIPVQHSRYRPAKIPHPCNKTCLPRILLTEKEPKTRRTMRKQTLLRTLFPALAVVAALASTACSLEQNDYCPGTLPPEPAPGERPFRPGDRYTDYGENPFVNTSQAPVSTFSVDCDGASYSNMRRWLNRCRSPNRRVPQLFHVRLSGTRRRTQHRTYP